jgi:hypothetical protein
MTDGGRKGDGAPDDDAFDGDDVVETVDDNAEVIRDYVDEVIGSAKLDSFVGGVAVGLFLVLPEGQREIAAIFAGLVGIELTDTHKRQKVPLDALGEGKYGIVGLAVGLLLAVGLSAGGII